MRDLISLAVAVAIVVCLVKVRNRVDAAFFQKINDRISKAKEEVPPLIRIFNERASALQDLHDRGKLNPLQAEIFRAFKAKVWVPFSELVDQERRKPEERISWLKLEIHVNKALKHLDQVTPDWVRK